MGDVRACRDTFVFYATDWGVSVGNKKDFDNSGSLGYKLFEFELSQNYRAVTAIISHSVSIFLLNAS